MSGPTTSATLTIQITDHASGDRSTAVVHTEQDGRWSEQTTRDAAFGDLVAELGGAIDAVA